MASRILVVEDDEFLCFAYHVSLTRSGFEVMIAADGQEALDILRIFTPRIILLDLVMPGMDGITALQCIKQDNRLKNIPVLIATNFGQEEDLAQARALGASGFIIKSNLSLQELTTMLDAIAGSHQPA